MVLSHPMELKVVSTPEDEKKFLELPLKIYRDDPEWIRPLDKDIKQVFDKNKNKFFRHGDAVRWLLYSDSDELIGRMAAFVNEKAARKNEQPTGGIGFFECINDQVAANMLFDAGKK